MVRKNRSYSKVGENHHRSKLTEKAVKAIRKLTKAGVERKALAEKYNVTVTTIGRVVNKETWSHL